MYMLRSILFVLVCGLGLAAAPAFAHSGDESGSGGASMMGAGSGGMMASGSGTMMGSGAGTMMGYGTGSTNAGGQAAASQQSGEDYLDAVAGRITQRYQLMQRIAEAKDESAKRQLVRQYLQSAHRYGRYSGAGGTFGRHWRGWGPGMMGYGAGGYGAMGPGMMGYGPMGYGAMGPGMMGYGAMGPGMMGYGAGGYAPMGPGMMGYGAGGYGPMGPGMMGYGPMGYGMMGPGMMGYGMMGYGGPGRAMMYPGNLTDEQLDRMADHMAEGFKDMQQIAQTTDKAERRKLLREHIKDMRSFWQDDDENDNENE